MTTKITESIVKEAAIGYFQELGHEYMPEPEICTDSLFAEQVCS